MFTMRQIALGGFLGVYAGCLPLTVNLARLPYWRGALVGVFFGALTHLMTTLIYVLVAIVAGNILDDPILRHRETWIAIGASIFVIQILSSVGCQIMGGYFLSPRRRRDPFEREKLYDRLKARDLKDNPPDAKKIHKSVVHDVVCLLETRPASADKRFSWFWIIIFGILSVVSILIWVHVLTVSCLDAIFFGVPVDAAWYLGIALKCLGPLAVLILVHLSVLGWLCQDVRKPQPVSCSN